MAELSLTKYSGFMEDFISFTIKNIHLFGVSSTETDLFLLKLATFKDSEGISPNVFANKYINLNAS